MTTKTGLDFDPNPGMPPKRGPGRPPKQRETTSCPEEILKQIEASAATRITVTGKMCDDMAAHLLSELPTEPRERIAAIAEARKWVAQGDKSESAAERQKLAEALAKNDADLARRVAMTGLQ